MTYALIDNLVTYPFVYCSMVSKFTPFFTLTLPIYVLFNIVMCGLCHTSLNLNHPRMPLHKFLFIWILRKRFVNIFSISTYIKNTNKLSIIPDYLPLRRGMVLSLTNVSSLVKFSPVVLEKLKICWKFTERQTDRRTPRKMIKKPQRSFKLRWAKYE